MAFAPRSYDECEDLPRTFGEPLLCEIIDCMLADEANNFSNIETVFLDRDGVINRNLADHYIRRWEEIELLPGVEHAIALLNRSGRKVIVVSNQRGVALGYCSETDLLALHERLQQHLSAHGARLDAIYYCPHDNGQCNCRKPLPGMFERAFRDFPGTHAGNSVMLGDSLCDVEAGARLGMRTIFIADATQPPKPGAAQAEQLASASAASLLHGVQLYLCPELPK